MCLQAHDATVPFGNFWKAVIWGIINLEFFFFPLPTTGFGKKCNKMLLTYVVLWKHSGFFPLALFCFLPCSFLVKEHQTDLNLKKGKGGGEKVAVFF